ncbi:MULTISPECIES: hypothetical protein [Glutamicibacter]|uniref:hypothetical protein n=1 Tax=Glutamicibacter nicotianae TaxID=37929 RepID=UPI002553B8FD|nr:hypothetical protein [Glutamicibacter nicotianae]WIV44706.1 hypothetical protein QQS42_03610 [Glutamicibacter nicotianae]
MERLLNGAAENCDGNLTKVNLAIEAGVSRATMHRATEVLADWEQQVGQDVTENIDELQLKALLSDEKLKNTELRAEVRRLTGMLGAAGSVILELQELLEQVNEDNITQLRRTSSPKQ